VFGFVVVAGLLFWGIDAFLAWATRHLLGTGT
jgi:preprotein translocase subunit SecE